MALDDFTKCVRVIGMNFEKKCLLFFIFFGIILGCMISILVIQYYR